MEFIRRHKKAIMIAILLKFCLVFFMAPMLGISDETILIVAILIVGGALGIVSWCFYAAFDNSCEAVEELIDGVKK